MTQRSEVLELPLHSIIVDDTDTPMQVSTRSLLIILAGPSAGLDRMLDDPAAVVLPAQVTWEPVS